MIKNPFDLGADQVSTYEAALFAWFGILLCVGFIVSGVCIIHYNASLSWAAAVAWAGGILALIFSPPFLIKRLFR